MDSIKRSNICAIGVSEGEQKKNGTAKNIKKKRIDKKCTNLENEMNLWT